MENRYVIVYTASGRQEAEILKSYLEAYGIDCEISQDAAGLVYGLSVGKLGMAELMVRVDQAEEARELLENFENPPEIESGDMET